MGSVEVTSTGVDFLTVDDVKRHSIIDFSDDDVLIKSLITAATRYCEKKTSRFFTPTNVTLSRNGFATEMPLTHKPVQEITSIVYDTDATTTGTTLADDQYELDKYNNAVRPAFNVTFPTARSHWNSVRISYRVGYYTGSPEDIIVPEDVKRAALLIVGDLYEHREAQQDMQLYENTTVDMLLAQYVVIA